MDDGFVAVQVLVPGVIGLVVQVAPFGFGHVDKGLFTVAVEIFTEEVQDGVDALV